MPTKTNESANGSAGVSFEKGNGGMPKLRLTYGTSVAEMYLHGAHVTHFQRGNDAPILWMSSECRFENGVPIRGGVPIIFPWFGPKEGAAAHGFARVKTWELVSVQIADAGIQARLRLPESDDAAKFGAFTIEYFVTVGEALGLELVVTNKGERELVFEDCLHTYFNVGAIESVKVAGLKGITYLDKVGGTTEKVETNEAIIITSETDRVYQDTASTVEIRDEKLRRTIKVEKGFSKSTVVWNPWIAKSKAMADFGDEEYHTMICVESGNVGKNKITLPPGQGQRLKVRLSTALH